jgi:predicted MFS family arabinose efflux permease
VWQASQFDFLGTFGQGRWLQRFDTTRTIGNLERTMTTLLSGSQIPAAESGPRPRGQLLARGERARGTLARRPAFWLVAAMTATLLAASSAPSPLYPVYQAEFGFSTITLTAIFAIYVLALLTSLLTVGRLSDYLGRRPVLAVALVVEAAAMAR